MKAWIQSVSNRQVFPAALRPEQVSFTDIPTALSRRVRFSGQTRQQVCGEDVPGLSVAQHCVIGSRLIAPPFALAFLLHEVSEVYLPDVPAPLKPLLFVDLGADGHVPWSELESRHADAVFEALRLSSIRSLIDSPEVKALDLAMLAAEKRDLMGPEPEPWGLTVQPVGTEMYPWGERDAYRAWVERFDWLTACLRTKPQHAGAA